MVFVKICIYMYICRHIYIYILLERFDFISIVWHEAGDFYGCSCVDTFKNWFSSQKKTWLATLFFQPMLLFLCFVFFFFFCFPRDIFNAKQWHLAKVVSIRAKFSLERLTVNWENWTVHVFSPGSGIRFLFYTQPLYLRLERQIQNPRQSDKCYIIDNDVGNGDKDATVGWSSDSLTLDWDPRVGLGAIYKLHFPLYV